LTTQEASEDKEETQEKFTLSDPIELFLWR